MDDDTGLEDSALAELSVYEQVVTDSWMDRAVDEADDGRKLMWRPTDAALTPAERRKRDTQARSTEKKREKAVKSKERLKKEAARREILEKAMNA